MTDSNDCTDFDIEAYARWLKSPEGQKAQADATSMAFAGIKQLRKFRSMMEEEDEA
ncbi:MAG: hypothetical protein ACXABY_18565 [Candidatus Thorarchaeota archaeon]|jgi:hypothetical protein